jgi:hypothetical protein
MKTKRNTASKVPDVLVVLICLIGLSVSLWMFWKDINMTLTKQSEVPVGEIEFKRRSAQRKFSDRVIWDRLQQSSPIYNGDTIRTADLSEAIITLEGRDDRIQLFDNSIIQILIGEDGDARIDLSGGNINIDKQDSSSSLTLVSGSNEIEVGIGSRITIQSDAAKEDLSVTVLAGSASLNSGQGSVTMDAGSALKVASDGSAESFVTIVDIIPYPASYTPEVSSTNIPIQFFWNAADFAEDEFVRLEISRDRNFSAIRQSIDTSGRNDATLTLDSPGAYYWRIYPANNDAESAAAAAENASVGRFDAVYAEAPQLITPAEGYTYNYRTQKPAVRMYWAGENPNAWYQVEIADNPQMNNPEATLVRESSMTNSALDAGDWYWRITPIYPNGFLVNNAPSSIGHFTIEQSGKLKAPELLMPQSETVIEMTNDDSSVYFSWRRDPEAVSYTMQISASLNMENPIISQELTDNFYAYTFNRNTLQAAQYYWAVYQKDREGNISPLSEIRPFIAAEEEIVYTSNFPPDNFAVADNRLQNVVFTWESSLEVPHRFQIAANSDFANPIINDVIRNSQQHQVNTLSAPIPAGNYYWRVLAETDEYTQEISTTPKRLSILPPLAAPNLINPAPESSLTIRPGTNIQFTWQPVAEADYYQFKLYRGDQIVFENLALESTAQSYAMNDISVGNYRWTVQPFIAENSGKVMRDGLIAASNFSAAALQRVSLDYPLSGQQYEGLRALENPDSVRWSSREPVGTSRFILSTNQNPLANPRSIIVDTRNSGNIIRLPSLQEGTYYWTIIADARDGGDISAVRASSFRVLPIPLLPAPSLISPENNHVFGLTELAENRGIHFSWQPVTGANRYVISIYTQDNFGNITPLIENQSLSGTSYNFTNMSLLDTGTFFWRLKAQNQRTNGTVIQEGNSAESTFTVDLPPLAAPKAIKPSYAESIIIRSGENLDFSWETIKEADYYQFKLYRGDQSVFENLAVTDSSVSYPMDNLTQGDYRWTIQAFSGALQRSHSGLISSNNFSAVVLQALRLDYPVNGYQYEGLSALNNPDAVRWSSREPVAVSRFILSTNPDPLSNPDSIIEDKQNPGNPIRLPSLGEGTYYWTIIAESQRGGDISAPAPSSFSVLPIPPLPAVNAVLPETNYVFGIEELAERRGILFEWQPVTGANRYVLSLYTKDDSGILTPILENQFVNGTSFAFDNMSALDTGNYVWRLAAQNRTSDGRVVQEGNSEEFSFMIDLPKLGTIRTNTPGMLYGN